MKATAAEVGHLINKALVKAKAGENSEFKTLGGQELPVVFISTYQDHYEVDGDDFTLEVYFEHSKDEVEPEQVGDWFTPPFPAEYTHHIETTHVNIIEESGEVTPLPITANMDKLTAYVVLNLIES